MTDLLSNLIPTLAANPVDHVTDKKLIQAGEHVPAFLSSDGTIWVISNVTIMLIISALVTAWMVIPAARRIQTGKNRTLDDFRSEGIKANLVESLCVYLRDQVFRDVLGKETDRYTPMLWTMFWFILVCNLVGMIPILDITAALFALLGVEYFFHHDHYVGIGGTATQSIWVTAALAVISACFYMGTAIKKDPVGFAKHLTGGAPVFMWPIMIPVEIMGYLIKPFALAIRLFANMTGGHLVIAVLLSFVPAAFEGLGAGGGAGISVVAIGGALAINFLEILVAFIQAYIFTFLTCLFLAQLVIHHDHDHEHEHDEHEGHEGHAAAAH